MSTSGSGLRYNAPPTYHADALMQQANPVQNTWYTILNTSTNLRVYGAGVAVADTNETLELKLTIDGNTLTGTQAAVAGTMYIALKDAGSNATTLTMSATQYNLMRYSPLDCKSFKAEVRKTTAAGVGTITGRVVYSQW